ncbi:hypothetical protein H8N00_34735 [Streptomyces sp. AC563]|uniref:hypothetical protein n=1 Tax=Streptomyces buecherae TaxID=2763006 RepID=UPI00164D82E1|nr:hypothetical protein [Streptomyces buecherae]MBC3993938.1 hypothetical protein [Streptomyces buecherae]
MTQARTVTSTAERHWAGIIADGVFKVVLGVGFAIGATRLDAPLGVPAWLLVTTGVALLIGGGIELRYVRGRPARTYIRLMIGYDGGWALATLAGLLVAWRGGTAGGEVWLGYQVAAPLALAALLVAAAPARPDARPATH